MARRGRRAVRDARARTASNATFDPDEQLASVFLSHVTDFRTRLNLKLVSKAFLHAERQDASTPEDPMITNNFGARCTEAGKDEDAYKWFKRASEQGQGEDSAMATCNVACCLFDGVGVKKNEVEAVKWWRRDAEAGYSGAMVYLAGIYGDGAAGVEKDPELWVAWLKRAVARGDEPVEASAMLGMAYVTGHGVERDVTLGVTYIKEAADRGFPRAQYQFGMMYKTGTYGVEQDIETALGWLEKAAEGSDADALCELAEHYYHAGEFEKTVSYLEKADLEKAEDHLYAKMRLAECYGSGTGVDKNLETALDLTLEAEEDGLEVPVQTREMAMRLLCKHALEMIQSPDRSRAQEAECLRLLRKLTDLDFGAAEYWLGTMYMESIAVDVDVRTGADWIRKAIEHEDPHAIEDMTRWMTQWEAGSEAGDPKSQLFLGTMYANLGRFRDSIALWEKARENGVIDWDVHIGECYERGEGVTKDMKRAVEYYMSAVVRGSELGKAKFTALGIAVNVEEVDVEEISGFPTPEAIALMAKKIEESSARRR